jgi:hypothetical protein
LKDRAGGWTRIVLVVVIEELDDVRFMKMCVVDGLEFVRRWKSFIGVLEDGMNFDLCVHVRSPFGGGRHGNSELAFEFLELGQMNGAVVVFAVLHDNKTRNVRETALVSSQDSFLVDDRDALEKALSKGHEVALFKVILFEVMQI